MNKYDGIFILKENLSEEEKNKTIEALKKCTHEIEETIDIGLRKLVYEIRGQKNGYYVQIRHISEDCQEIEKQARLDDNIIKFVNVVIERDIQTQKNKICRIMRKLKEIEEEFGYKDLETAFYIHARYGEDDYTEQQIKDIYEAIVNTDDTLFNKDINEEVENIIGGENHDR